MTQQPVRSNTLMVGDTALASPRYDYATLFTPDANASVATLGREKENPGYRARPDDRAFTERHPELPWFAPVGVVLVLGMVAVRTAKGTPEAGLNREAQTFTCIS